MKQILKRFTCLVTAMLLIVSLVLPSFPVAAASTSKGSAQELSLMAAAQSTLDGLGTPHWYKITPTETQYYRFTIRNQSVEVRTGISVADDLLNIFLGGMSVTVYDAYDDILAEREIRCGYTAALTLKLAKGATYYVKLTSTVAGNYRLSTTAFADMGADTWDGAEEVLPSGQLISSVEAAGDEDWFCFRADEERSYYSFRLENISGSAYMTFRLYEYVEGAGETPLRDLDANLRVYTGATAETNLQLKENALYYYCITATSGTGGYQLDVVQTLDAAGNKTAESYPIERDTAYTTSFDGDDDVDYFSFTTAPENAYYHIDFESLSAKEYSEFYLYDAAGNEKLHGRRYSTGTLSENVQLEPNSTYYLMFEGDEAGNYTFTVSCRPDTYYDTKEKAAEIALDETYTTSFDGDNDRDWVRFTTAPENAYYHIDFESLSAKEYNWFYLYDEAGNELTNNRRYSTGKLSKNILLEPDTTYYLLFKGDKAGNYTFTVSCRQDSYYDTKDKAATIKLNNKITTAFEGDDDADWMCFTTLSGTVFYTFTMETLSAGEYNKMYLYDEAVTEAFYARRYSTGTLSETVCLEPETTYYLKFTGDKPCRYSIEITYQQDYEGNTKETATKLSLNKLLECRLEGGADEDWFAVTLSKDGYYRLRTVNESCDSLKVRVYSARDKEVLSYSGDTAELTAGTYYVKVYGDSGYYSVVLADCGNAHKETYRYSAKATLTQNGVKKYYCKSCGSDIRSTTVTQLKSISLSATSFTYTGSRRRPTVTVLDKNGKKITDYSLSWSSSTSTAPGKYTVTVTLKGAYSGTKKLTYTIKPIDVSKCKLSLSSTSYTYDGKVKSPSVTVKNANGTKLTKNTHYTVTYASGRKYVGKYKVTVKMKGNYSGTKTLYFTVNPPKTTVKSLTAGSKSLKVAITKKSTQVSGYQIQYSTSKKFTSAKTKTLSSYKTTSYTLKSLKAKTTYYVRVRTYKTVDGKKYYSGWSSYKYKKTK